MTNSYRKVPEIQAMFFINGFFLSLSKSDNFLAHLTEEFIYWTE